MSEAIEYYIPAEDEPSVFCSAVNVNEYGSARYDTSYWSWANWFNAKQKAEYFASWKEKNPGQPVFLCPPSWFATHDPIAMGLGLIVRLREELKANRMPGPPVFDPAPTMFIGDTRQISLRWVLQHARDNNVTPEEAALVAEQERDMGGLTLDNQEYWRDRWWKDILTLPGYGYPIWRYTSDKDVVAVPYLLMPGPRSESIVIVQVHEKNPNISYKLVTIREKGGEVVGEFTGYEGFGQQQLTALLNTFWAGF
jgi:hypothetical protein